MSERKPRPSRLWANKWKWNLTMRTVNGLVGYDHGEISINRPLKHPNNHKSTPEGQEQWDEFIDKMSGTTPPSQNGTGQT